MIKMMICMMGKMDRIVFDKIRLEFDKMIILVDGKIVLTRMGYMFPCDRMMVLDKVILGLVSKVPLKKSDEFLPS